MATRDPGDSAAKLCSVHQHCASLLGRIYGFKNLADCGWGETFDPQLAQVVDGFGPTLRAALDELPAIEALLSRTRRTDGVHTDGGGAGRTVHHLVVNLARTYYSAILFEVNFRAGLAGVDGIRGDELSSETFITSPETWQKVMTRLRGLRSFDFQALMEGLQAEHERALELCGPGEPPRNWSLKQLAELLCVRERQVARLIEAGKLKARKIGHGTYRVDAASLEQCCLDRSRKKPAKE